VTEHDVPRAPSFLCGTVPPAADGYYRRPETGPDLAGLRPGEAVALVHGEVTYSAPASQGGTGKTQLAAEYARALRDGRAVDVLVWVTAASRESILAGFAQAAELVSAGQPGEDARAAARRLVSWLARTRRPWLVVLDDLAEVGDLEDLWPAGPAGRVVITTRLPAASFGKGVRVAPVPGLNRSEALAYLSSRLPDQPGRRSGALDLAEDLDGLPLGLAQAAAVMSARGLGCREYRAELRARMGHLPAVDGVSAPVLATCSIAAQCARERASAGPAWPALVLAAAMDHHGVPGAVLASPAACSYITGRPSTAGEADRNAVRAAIGSLARLGLVTIDPGSAARTVQMHASVRAAVRAWLPATELEPAVLAAASALLEAWPPPHGGAAAGGQAAALEQALRDCALAVQQVAPALRASDGGVLWKPEAHPLLFRAGLSLEDGGLYHAAIAHWKSMAATSARLLGAGHGNTVAARDRLAAAHESAGRHAEAIALFQAALADRERNQGPEHAEAIEARGHLARAYQSAGRPAEAIALHERAAADSARLLGTGHAVTRGARAALAEAYRAAGRHGDAISGYRILLAEAERHLGAGHPTTLAARSSLGAAHAAGGQAREAVAEYKRALADHERTLGPGHPDTVAARARLASAYRAAGRQKEAIAQYERVLADHERTLGPDHPGTIAARAGLAYAYRGAGRLREAVPLYERVLADRVRVQGDDHPDALTARSNLAACYLQARRLTDAIPAYERALADDERMRGPGDMETLTTRCNLASAYYAAGRLTDVVAVLQRALADCERYLGPGHQMTQTVRENLAAAT
jgi:tetratricopeptide (TPR) repeat protein